MEDYSFLLCQLGVLSMQGTHSPMRRAERLLFEEVAEVEMRLCLAMKCVSLYISILRSVRALRVVPTRMGR